MTQGCPVSVLIFILIIEILSNNIKDDKSMVLLQVWVKRSLNITLFNMQMI